MGLKCWLLGLSQIKLVLISAGIIFCASEDRILAKFCNSPNSLNLPRINSWSSGKDSMHDVMCVGFQSLASQSPVLS